MSANPNIFQIVSADAGVIALLGNNPTRFFPFARAPKLAPMPYAVYQVYSGIPQNYIDKTPDIDNKGTQIDIYAKTAEDAENVYNAVRDALEPHFHMTNFTTPERDGETDEYHVRMEFDVWQPR